MSRCDHDRSRYGRDRSRYARHRTRCGEVRRRFGGVQIDCGRERIDEPLVVLRSPADWYCEARPPSGELRESFCWPAEWRSSGVASAFANTTTRPVVAARLAMSGQIPEALGSQVIDGMNSGPEKYRVSCSIRII